MCKDVYFLTLKYLVGHNIGECKHMFLHRIFVEFNSNPLILEGGGGGIMENQEKIGKLWSLFKFSDRKSVV